MSDLPITPFNINKSSFVAVADQKNIIIWLFELANDKFECQIMNAISADTEYCL